MSDDPYVVAWRDQFKALMRDKVLAMARAIEASGFDTLAHVFDDPYDDDRWRLQFESGTFFLINLESGSVIQVDLGSLGL